MKMNIVVTGGTGFLGSYVVNSLRNAKDYNVFSISRHEGVDMRDYSQLKRYIQKIKADVMIHCAAVAGGIAINAVQPVELFENNMFTNLHAVKVCNELNINTLINIMPNCVYPGHLEEYVESTFWDGAIHESVLTAGLPKRMMWGHCFAYCQQNPKFKPIHLVLSNMYGPSDHFRGVRAHALGALISRIVDAKHSGKKTVEIWGTGTPIREWLYVEDGAEAIKRTMESKDEFKANDIVNIGVSKGISIKDLAMLIKETVGWEGEFIFNTDKPDGAMKKILIAKKMKEKLNWEPLTKLKDGIRKTVEWYEQNKENI